MRTFIRLLVALLLLGGIFGGIFGWKYYQQMQGAGGGPSGLPTASVAATEVASEEWQGRRTAVGSLSAVDTVAVSTEVAGVIESISFDSGQAVEAGDLLVQLDAEVDRAELEGLRAQAELARIEFERAENLLPRRAISQSEFDQARAQLDNATAAVRTQQARIRQKAIRAPFTGLLGIRGVSVGEYLSPGTPIVELRQLAPIYADFSLPERFLPELEPGRTVEVEVNAYDEVFRGEITAIDSGVDVGTRSISVRATLDNDDRRLRPGMFAQVAVLAPERREVMTIPRTAVSFNTYGDFTYRINETGDGLVAERVQIRTGESRNGYVEVLEGLEQGERVVAAGLVRVRDGQPVEIDETVALDHSEISGR
ncbi:efflux RND transporter periplasmic adaptor subunit [Sediminicurvatus halobius]|uniref:Efflux transporter periplasmic adaptor subunit n=1 Tax=Sediminicurvatus halobius TaxID=2182432 RepID=A0A2U2N1I1_9GAMM|nr:efflux RND transporter periplasmic adaptor subunit [Spiribacter halobius]PWG62923.1 efflux transporter periplasmic adaptor subunit [Spiribacter halobius]UEX77434.1 efflux RND transporter periplasmic adaptor subunit [Spiribacter halobius]